MPRAVVRIREDQARAWHLAAPKHGVIIIYTSTHTITPKPEVSDVSLTPKIWVK